MLRGFEDLSLRLLLASGGTRLRHARLELLDATRGVHNLLCSGVERMRDTRHFNMRNWVLLAIFPSICLFTLDSGADQKAGSRRVIVEDHLAVVLWMDICFHSGGTIQKPWGFGKSALA